MEKMNDLKGLLNHEIQDLYSVEEQIIEALPAMIQKASNTKLKNALSTHLRVTEEHKKRLEKIQKQFSVKQEDKKGFLAGIFGNGKQVCKGMEGILEEGKKMMNEDMEPKVMDAVIIACAQKVEHYEICGYGTVRTYAKELGLDKVSQLLEQTLNEEYEADDLLTKLAESGINQKAETGTPKGNTRPEMLEQGARTKSEGSRTKRETMMEPVSHPRGSSSSRGNSTSRGTTSRKSSSGRSNQVKPGGKNSRSGSSGKRG